VRRPPDGLTITSDPARIDVAAVHAFLTESYWSPGVPRAVVEKAIAGSLPFAAILDGATIGFARVVTDRATFAYLADVYVLPERRGHGIAHALMDAVLAHPDLQTVRRFVLVTRDAHALYADFGFTALAAPERYMERVRSAAALYAPR
jgi:GNAT superfamily N-acetyltransferase